jgi:hypothetical protein
MMTGELFHRRAISSSLCKPLWIFCDHELALHNEHSVELIEQCVSAYLAKKSNDESLTLKRIRQVAVNAQIPIVMLNYEKDPNLQEFVQMVSERLVVVEESSSSQDAELKQCAQCGSTQSREVILQRFQFLIQNVVEATGGPIASADVKSFSSSLLESAKTMPIVLLGYLFDPKNRSLLSCLRTSSILKIRAVLFKFLHDKLLLSLKCSCTLGNSTCGLAIPIKDQSLGWNFLSMKFPESPDRMHYVVDFLEGQLLEENSKASGRYRHGILLPPEDDFKKPEIHGAAVKVDFKKIKSRTVIDCGAFGRIEKALIGDRPFVLKIKHDRPEIKNDDEETNFREEVFQGEIEYLSKIRHPAVVKMLDSFEQNDERGIVLEYCNSGTLRNWIDTESAKSSLETKLNFIRDLAEVLDYLASFQKLEVIHRDL